MMIQYQEQISQFNHESQTSRDSNNPSRLDQKQEVVNLQKHDIDLQNEIIFMKTGKISYKKIGKQLKFCLIQSYRKCLEKRCIKQIWKNSCNQKKSQSQITFLKDDDALHLISKMMQKIQKKNIQNKIMKKTNQLQNIRNHTQTLKSIQANHKEKLANINKLKLPSNMNSKKIQIINQLQAFIDSVIKQKTQKYNEFSRLQKQIQQLQKEMSVYKLNEDKGQYKNLLIKTIRKMSRNLFIEMILFIVQISKAPNVLQEDQIDQSEVYVIFEQSYHSIKIKKRYLVQIISAKIYHQKVIAYQSLYVDPVNADKAKNQMKDIMCCHKCMKIFPAKSLKFCQQQIRQNQTKSYPSTDYNFYRQLNINGNYSYQNSKQYILPYFIYNKQNNKSRCKRAICKECQKLYPSLNHNKNYKCSFCDGSCNCSRCVLAYTLVKVIGYDKKDADMVRSYDKILNLMKNEKCCYKLQILNLRSKNDDSQLKIYALTQRINPHKKIIKEISPPINKQAILTSPQGSNINIEDQLLSSIHLDLFNPSIERKQQQEQKQQQNIWDKNQQQLNEIIIHSNSNIVNDNHYEENLKFPQRIEDDVYNNDLFQD